jgi:Heterokaryon incompatibility protein (HET)
MANTKGRSVEGGGDIGYFWIHHCNSNTLKPDHFNRYLDAHVRIRRAQDAHDAANSPLSSLKYPDPLPAIRSWLSKCLAHSHKSDWIQPRVLDVNDHTKPKHIHLIDCYSLCVVRKEFRSDLKSAALSYVWGQVEQLLLCGCNYDELLEENSLCLWRRKLSGSIRDTMDLYSALFIQYLWLDSLCIIQDNPHDKNLHNNNMHRIYQAVLTIVSAAGKDANAGLPAFGYDFLLLNLGVAIRGCTCTVRIQEHLVFVVSFPA